MSHHKISGTFATHETIFQGTVTFNSETGLITGISHNMEDDSIRFNSESCIIFPGFGDIHIHGREDVSQKDIYKEDFLSAGSAALHGGVVHVADMPNNPIPPVDDSSYNEKEKLTHKSPIHITLYAGIGPSTKPLTRNVPYKVFMGPSIGELYFRDNQSLENTIQHYKGENVSFHCEDPEVLEQSKHELSHEDRRPKQAEILATEFALYLIKKYQLRGKLCHYSTGEGLQKILKAKREGVSVTCEVTPTHLFFDRSMLTEENHIWFQMNPPLRDPSDKEILLEALRKGDIDYLATDHAPHSIEEKLKGISGISQLDTYALFVTYLIIEKKFDPKVIARVASYLPGEFVRPYLPNYFGKGFGKLEVGYSASFSILNLKKPHLFEKSSIKSKSGWSPFEGFQFPGSIEGIFYRGIQKK